MKTTSIRANHRHRGLSLIELLTVVAVIGIIAAIILPHFSGFSSEARKAVARRNAQQVASVLNVAFAAGAEAPAGWSASTTGADIINQALTGLVPANGAFAGKKFAAQNLENEVRPLVEALLSFDPANKVIRIAP